LYGDLKLYLLEHETFGDDAASIIIDENKKVVLDDVYNGFDDFDYAVNEGLLVLAK